MKKIITFIVIFFTISFLLITSVEIILRYLGLGTPLIYEKSYQFGYVPSSNQKLIRFNNKKITIDDNGFRGSIVTNNPKNKIYFLGDSVTYGGSYIDDEELFSNKFCKKINQYLKKDFSCYNGGVNAYGLENIIKRYESIKKDKKTYVIITLIPGNFSRNFVQIESLPYFTKKHTHFLKATTELSAFYLDIARAKLRFDEKKFSLDQKLDGYLEKKIINDLNKLKSLQKIDHNLIIIFFPPKQFVLENDSNKFHKFFFKNITNEKNSYNLVKFFNLYENINNLYYDEIHLSSKGHQVVSELLFELLKNNFR
jgi:lysophospholipase L1-like esterase